MGRGRASLVAAHGLFYLLQEGVDQIRPPFFSAGNAFFFWLCISAAGKYPEAPMMEFLFSPEFWARWLGIVVLDLSLGGDNALVIAMAVRTLPPREQFFGRLG